MLNNEQSIIAINDEFKRREHFRGYFESTSIIQNFDTPVDGDYAYIAENETKWIYEGSSWSDSGVNVPDQSVPTTMLVPLMNGVATIESDGGYAPGDHIHPVDTSRTSQSQVNGILNRIQNISSDEILDTWINGALSTKSLTTTTLGLHHSMKVNDITILDYQDFMVEELGTMVEHSLISLL